MKNYIFVLIVLVFVGCNSEPEDLATKEFIDSIFFLEQRGSKQGNYFWQPDLNQGLPKESLYFSFMNENELALGYLKWNLIDEKLPDSIKYSTKSFDQVQNDFLSFANQDKDIERAIQLFIYPEKFINQHQINIDSLSNLSSKLFYASSAGEGRVGWSFCAGKSKFPDIYGKSKSYESVILQALCFQAVFEEKYSNPDKTVWNFFNQKIPEVTTEMNSIEYDDYIEMANQLMWEKMSESEELKNLLVGFTTNESSKLYFNVKNN